MTEFYNWLNEATRKLSKESAEQVRIEIRAHFDSAREEAIEAGRSPEDADRLALAALGNARAANIEYRKVLLTSDEAKLLREANWVCVIPAVPLIEAALLFLTAAILEGWSLQVSALGIAAFLIAPYLPVYTPWRARVLRALKWAAMLATVVLTYKYSWLMITCLWPFALNEWNRASIRRKLPFSQWPKQLYL